MQKSNLIKKLLVITNIIWIISFISILIFQSKFTYSLYWIIVPLIIIFSVLFIHEIDKGKIDTDIDKSSLIKRAYNDSTTILIVAYVLAYLIIDFTDMLKTGIKDNLYLVIGFFVATCVYELFLYLSIMNANKETRTLLKNKK